MPKPSVMVTSARMIFLGFGSSIIVVMGFLITDLPCYAQTAAALTGTDCKTRVAHFRCELFAARRVRVIKKVRYPRLPPASRRELISRREKCANDQSSLFRDLECSTIADPIACG